MKKNSERKPAYFANKQTHRNIKTYLYDGFSEAALTIFIIAEILRKNPKIKCPRCREEINYKQIKKQLFRGWTALWKKVAEANLRKRPDSQLNATIIAWEIMGRK